jgi:ABC-type glycerol-3-phosphate transport system substrate-binding protein
MLAGMKKLALAGALLAATTTLTACGSGSSAYCSDLKSATKQFDSLESNDLGKIDEAFKTFHELADEAPSDIKSDWKVLDDGITSVEKALDDAGLKMSDLAKVQSGNLPEGVDMTKLQGLASEFQKLGDEKFTKASDAIEKHAKDECDVDLKTS